ncbi:30S ribosomal protein S25e [Vulcanisaeta thermophila]|uniref:30S ribosomal protein S25e n=1 Tax=Vulcanisaeta thermophila TaxID=867917 RepID=UPI000852BF36|nr:30S ribosomal protein S25e [Vulcanisaeta thermophila]
MGGKKKPTLSQLAKKQEKQQAAQAKPAGKGKKVVEERQVVKSSLVDPKLLSDIEKDVVKWDYVTPYLVASKYNIKMSTAFQVLRALASKGSLVLVSKGHRTEIYTAPSNLKGAS